MRWAVMGAGAVGCYYGGLLARAGQAVTLIARGAHLQALRQHGLVMDLPEGRVVVPVAATDDPAAVRDAEVVLVCVKSGDTEAAGAAIAPHLPADAQVLSLQNGVDNAQRLQQRLGRPVHPAVVYVAATLPGAGHVRHHGRGELVLPQDPLLDAAAQALQAAGVGVERSASVPQALWSKLVINCCWNALSAITHRPYGLLGQGEGVQRLQRDVLDECVAVARAEGVPLDAAALWAAVQRIAHTMPRQTSSTEQDLSRGRRTEIGQLNGFVVRRGEARGIPTPANRVLAVLVRQLEPHEAPPEPRLDAG